MISPCIFNNNKKKRNTLFCDIFKILCEQYQKSNYLNSYYYDKYLS